MVLLWGLILTIGSFSVLAAYRNMAVLRYRLTPPGVGAGEPRGLVTVVIPARNEEANIRDCVQSVLEQRYRPLEIVVVDDNSTDATGRILAETADRYPELAVVKGEPLPPGWVGKNHAIYQGVARAKGEWYIFLDADTRMEPEAVARSVALAVQRDLAMFSFLPHHQLISFWEKVVQPVVLGVVFAGAPPSLTEDPNSGVAGAFGQFILFKRAAYEAIGGHEGVKGEVLEDWRMAQKIKAMGLRVGLVEGQDLVRVRMYTSFSGLWEGWSKNVFHGAGKKLSLLAVVLVFTFVMGVWPVLLVFWALAAALLGGPSFILLTVAAAFQLAVTLFYASWVNRRMRMPESYALGFPLGSAIFMGILLNSAYRILSGRGVTWKGRKYT